VFVSKQVAVALLAGHLGTLCLFLWRWAKIPRKLSGDAPAFTLLTLMTSNFIGVAFARTLHYQFFSWYFHCLPILAFSVTDLPTAGIAAILLGVEVAFNVFPATSWSSAILQVR
jgi:alpha-1,3-mannosyltransferase